MGGWSDNMMFNDRSERPDRPVDLRRLHRLVACRLAGVRPGRAKPSADCDDHRGGRMQHMARAARAAGPMRREG